MMRWALAWLVNFGQRFGLAMRRQAVQQGDADGAQAGSATRCNVSR